jgi:multiple sugar transport system ATP-binding protein
MAHIAIDATPAVTEDVRELRRDAGSEDLRTETEQGGALLVGRFGARSRVRPGDEVVVAVDTRSLHFFEPETGTGIYDERDTKGAGS